jgi:hypothetical protein
VMVSFGEAVKATRMDDGLHVGGYLVLHGSTTCSWQESTGPQTQQTQPRPADKLKSVAHTTSLRVQVPPRLF